MSLLVATDLSARSDRALNRAIMVARHCGMPLTVIHVLDEELPKALQERYRTAALETLHSQLNHLGMPDAPVETPEGHAHEAILASAETLGADLIIVGAHRGRGIRDLFSGTTAERIIRNGHRPVLMVSTAPTHDYARAVTGVDFSAHGVHAAGVAAALFPECRQRLVHVYDVPFGGLRTGTTADEEAQQDHRARLDALLAEQWPSRPDTFETEIRRGIAVEVLRKEVDMIHADLLVIGTRGQGGAFGPLGSVAHDLLAAPPCDILVAHAPGHQEGQAKTASSAAVSR